MTKTVPEIVRHEMGPGEQALWIGNPNARRYASIKGLYWFLLGIPWMAFAVYAEYRAITAPAALSEQHSMSVLLLLAGSAMIVQPFWHHWRALRTIYLVTDQRLMIFDRVIWWTIESYYPPFDIETRQHPDGSASLFFSRVDHSYGDLNLVAKEIGLFALPDATAADDHIMQIKPEAC